MSLNLDLSGVFSCLDAYILGRSTTHHKDYGVCFSMYHIRRHMMSAWCTTDDAKVDHLVNMVSASFLHCKIIIFTCVINGYFLGKYSENNTLFLIKPLPTRLSIH